MKDQGIDLYADICHAFNQSRKFSDDGNEVLAEKWRAEHSRLVGIWHKYEDKSN